MLARAQSPLKKVVVVDIARIEGGRRPKNDLAVLADGPLAELAGLKRFALLAADRARRQVRRGISGQIAQLTWIPQLERLDRAVLDERSHLVRCAKSRQHDLPFLRRSRQVARRGRDAD